MSRSSLASQHKNERLRPGSRWRAGLAGACALVILAPGSATGQQRAYLAEARADVDGDGRIDVIRIDNPPAVSITASGSREMSGFKPFTAGQGRRLVSAELELGSGKPYRGRTVVVAIGHFAATDRAPATSEAMVLEWRTRPRPGWAELWRGEVGPQGRDGEWSLELAATPLGLMRYQRRPGVERCDGAPAYLFAEAFDFRSDRFRPVNPPLRVTATRQLVATRTPPAGATDAPPVVFRASAASTQAEAANAGELAVPRELDDGDPGTAWREGRGGFGKGEFVTLRAHLAGAAVRAIRLVPGDARDRASFAAGNRLKRAALLIGGELAAWVVVPRDPLTDAGAFTDPYWVDLGSPIAADCVSLVVADVYPGRRRGDTAISELAALTEVDLAAGGGYAALVDRVVAGGAGADTAARTLSRGGHAAAEAILGALAAPDVAPATALRLRRALAPTGDPIAAPTLAAGLAAPRLTATDRRLFSEALSRIGAPAVAPVAGVVADSRASPAGRMAAVEVLASIDDPSATAALLAAVGRGTPALRRRVDAALGRRPDALADLVAAAGAAAAAGEADREGDLWRAIGKLGRTRPAGPHVAALAARLATARAYSLRYRLLDAGASIPAAALVAAVSAHLAATGQSPTDQALRRVAAAALARNPLPEARAALLALADDPDPGVRRAVAVGLGQRDDRDDASDRALASRLAGDHWPMVRIAAAGALTPRCQLPSAARPLVAAVDADPDSAVRVAALSALVGCRAAGIGPRLVTLARTARQPTTLRLRAVSLIATLDDPALTGQLVQLLAEFRKQAWSSADAVELARAATAALGALGGRAAVDPLLEAARDEAFPAIQAAAVTGLGRLCPRAALPLFDHLAGSAERSVAVAARAARRGCRKRPRR